MYRVRTADCCCDTDLLVPAGEASSGICGDVGSGVELARIQFPEQEYVSTFCPERALACGTVFPELVNAG